MHIMEGYLPWQWCVFWYSFSAPFIIYGIYLLNKQVKEHRETLSLLAVSGAFIFLLSSLKMPSPVVGSCSHPTGTGLSTVLFGPFITCVLSATTPLKRSRSPVDIPVNFAIPYRESIL